MFACTCLMAIHRSSWGSTAEGMIAGTAFEPICLNSIQSTCRKAGEYCRMCLSLGNAGIGWLSRFNDGTRLRVPDLQVAAGPKRRLTLTRSSAGVSPGSSRAPPLSPRGAWRSDDGAPRQTFRTPVGLNSNRYNIYNTFCICCNHHIEQYGSHYQYASQLLD
jgi:hypothetical protein